MEERTETQNVGQIENGGSLQSAVDALVMPGLLPCPFCGAPGEIIEAPAKWKPHMQIKVICSAQCDGMDEEWWDKESTKRAVEVWNTRTTFTPDWVDFRQGRVAGFAEGYEAAAEDMLPVLEEVRDCAAYWSEYDVPIGLADRINRAVDKVQDAIKSGRFDATQPDRACEA